jgi:SpoIID/LytB domain protein
MSPRYHRRSRFPTGRRPRASAAALPGLLAALAFSLPPAAPASARAVEGGASAVGASQAGGAPSAGAAASRRAGRREPTLLIEGAGDGHGVGMSQWGALGFAQHGWSFQAILAHYYEGTSIGQVSTKRIVKVLVKGRVRKIPIEAYVRGVVAAEMPSSWPQAALEAQAIASRTYAITDHAGGARFDVYSDTRSQVYLGKAAETPASNAAVKATAGQVVTYEGEPAITFFFASSGGRTESVQNSFIGAAPEPWLKGVPDPYDGGPLHRWKVKLTFAQAAKRLAGLFKGAFEGVEVVRRGFSPRIVLAYVLGSKGRGEVSGPELAARLGLYDSWAYFSVTKGGKIRREPDLSGSKPPAAEPAPSQTPPSGPQGGVRAP